MEQKQIGEIVIKVVEASLLAADSALHMKWGNHALNPFGVPIKGKVKFQTLDDYGDEEGKMAYESPVMESPTWLEIFIFANERLRIIGDSRSGFQGVHIYDVKDRESKKIKGKLKPLKTDPREPSPGVMIFNYETERTLIPEGQIEVLEGEVLNLDFRLDS